MHALQVRMPFSLNEIVYVLNDVVNITEELLGCERLPESRMQPAIRLVIARLSAETIRRFFRSSKKVNSKSMGE